MPNHAMTPHISGTTIDAQIRYAAGTKDMLESSRHVCFVLSAVSTTTFLTPPPSPGKTLVIYLETVSNCDSGKDSRQSPHSPTSVLRFNANDPETEYKTELETELIELSPERKSSIREESLESLFPEPYSLPDLCLAGEYFWDPEIPPDPLFLDEIEIQEPLLNTAIPKEATKINDFSFTLDEDFESCPWDVGKFFEQQLWDNEIFLVLGNFGGDDDADASSPSSFFIVLKQTQMKV
ncbi:unnamed protein product [Microthlaspi erraticum]|uniref:D-isomer specific 2-hydroxyacid dehydrogenase NAD-binding domain-containing protein n=1 Tax=Microthlaspi erraticum TaxID=1685480 RepID=A0A6D2JAC9_9BRAS|nr:unnamed protein product [Microthlaspi erraticum]